MQIPVQPPRQRLMRGLALAVADKGYAAVTIADIARRARTSKRTFYEHFVDKEACLLALYEENGIHLMTVLSQVPMPADMPVAERVRSITAAYLGALDAMHSADRRLMQEAYAAGERARELRAHGLQAFADLMCALVEEGRRTQPEARPLSPMVALIIVGGVHELILRALDPDGGAPSAHPFTDFLEPVTDLVTAVLRPRD